MILLPNKAVWYAESKLAFVMLYSLVIFCRTNPKKIENSSKTTPEICITVIPDKNTVRRNDLCAMFLL